MNKWLELLLGIILVIVPLMLIQYYPSIWTAALAVLLGSIFWCVIGLGLLFILLGLADLRG